MIRQEYYDDDSVALREEAMRLVPRNCPNGMVRASRECSARFTIVIVGRA